MSSQDNLLELAFRQAIEVCAQSGCSSHALALTITLSDQPDFVAEIKYLNDRCFLSVSIGLLCKLNCFWHTVKFEHPRGLYSSLVWLILHEIHHSELGHFRFSSSFGVSKRAKLKERLLRNLPPSMWRLARPCLELQADQDATELLLECYSPVSLHDLQQKITAIAAMMVLIEREEVKLNFDEMTHPKAATRIFQLLCHVAEMPLIHAHLHHDSSLLPPADEIERFSKEVTLPCYFDAVHLAEVAGAKSIQADLGSPEDFFADMAIAKLGDPSRYSDLKTEGAKEWAQLWECNEALKPLQIGVHFAN